MWAVCITAVYCRGLAVSCEPYVPSCTLVTQLRTVVPVLPLHYVPLQHLHWCFTHVTSFPAGYSGCSPEPARPLQYAAVRLTAHIELPAL